MLTVADVLELPAMQRGLPEVVAGGEYLDRPVRWAHVLDVADVSGLLRGGEFVLNNGFGIGLQAAAQRSFMRELAKQDVSAVAVELGLCFKGSLPAPMSAEAKRASTPLIQLRRKTRFVEVTEAIHSQLISDEVVELRRKDQLSRRLTHTLLSGGDVPEVLQETARTLGNPLLVEDALQRVVALATYRCGEDIVLRAWQDLLEAERQEGDDPEGYISVPVQLRGGPWGRIVALQLDGGFDPFAHALIEETASVISLRLASQEQIDHLAARSRGELIGDLLTGKLGEQEVARRASAAGFHRTSRHLIPLALGWRSRPTESADPLSWLGLARELRNAFGQAGMLALIGIHGKHLLLIVDPRRAEQEAEVIDSVAQTVLGAANRCELTQDDFAISVGQPAERWIAVGRGLQSACRHANVASTEAPALWHDARRVGLNDIIEEMSGSQTLRAFLQARLGPLVDAGGDPRRDEYVRTLEAYLKHGGRKTPAAQALCLERQSLYHRLDRLKELLDIDWYDGDQVLELHVALRVLRVLSEPEPGSDEATGQAEARSGT